MNGVEGSELFATNFASNINFSNPCLISHFALLNIASETWLAKLLLWSVKIIIKIVFEQ